MIEQDKKATVSCISFIKRSLQKETYSFLMYLAHPLTGRAYNDTSGLGEHMFSIGTLQDWLNDQLPKDASYITKVVKDDFKEILTAMETNSANYFRVLDA